MPKHEVASCLKLGCAAYDKLAERIKELEAEIRAWREKEYCNDCSAKTILPEPHGIGCKAKKRIKELYDGVQQVIADSNEAQIEAANRIRELEADLKIKQSVCETVEKEVTAINEKLKTENKQLRELKCPPISDGDTCICPIEELEGKLKEYGNHKRSCAYVHGLSGHTIEKCDCGLE